MICSSPLHRTFVELFEGLRQWIHRVQDGGSSSPLLHLNALVNEVQKSFTTNFIVLLTNTHRQYNCSNSLHLLCRKEDNQATFSER